MNKPEILGLEVETPDGRGSILTLHFKRVTIALNSLSINKQESVIVGLYRGNGGLHRSYRYEDVEIIKG